MGFQVISGPASQPVSLAEAKAHLRYDDDDQDTLIEAMIKAATAHAEAFTGLALIDQTIDHYLDAFPTSGPIVLPRAPLIEVVGVYSTDSEGDEQTMAAAEYVADRFSSSAKVTLASGESWPTPISQANAVRIRFRAGYLSTDSPPVAAVPFDIRAAILLIVGSLFEHREEIIIGQTAFELPWGAKQLLRPHVVYT